MLRLIRSAVTNLVTVVVALAVACGIGELVVRIVAPQQVILKRPDIWKPRDTLGWDHRANVNSTVNTGERTVHIRTDENGFRVGMDGPVTGDNQVLLIGDSFTEALQVEYEQSFAGLLQKALAARPGPRVAVRNAGVAAWDPPQYLRRMEELLARDHYDLVVVNLYLGNDVVPRRYGPLPPREIEPVYHFRFPRSFRGPELVEALVRPIDDLLKTRSQLFILVKYRTQTLRKQIGLAPVDYPVGFLKGDASRGLWGVTTDICADIAAVAAKARVPIFFVLLPTAFQVDTTILADQRKIFHIPADAMDADQPTRIMRDSLQGRGLRVVDALPALRAAQGKGAPLYGKIDSHLSPRGHEVVANLITRVVIDYLNNASAGKRGRPSSPPGKTRH